MGNTTLASEYPSLYAIASDRHLTVATIFENTPINLRFRRNLVGINRDLWFHLVERLMRIQLTDGPDKFNWSLTPTGVFSVKSYYAELMNGHTTYLRKYLWKLKVPLKIVFFCGFSIEKNF